MTSVEVRRKYIEYFKKEPRNHAEIEPAPLVLENDPTTLFTSAGMQPLTPYLTGEPHPSGTKRLVNSQPSIRLQDIEEVGDNRHTTFFEMLGNWSLGDYFKEEQLNWIWEFFTKELSLPKEKLWVSVFEGDNQVPKDIDSYSIWKKIGIPEKKIVYYPADKNWWSMTGTPKEMQVGHIGGPDSEVFYDFGQEYKFHENSEFKSKKCHPNCDCGRFLEIGNSVFIQYKKVTDSSLEELPQKNVDFGGGLERIVAAVNNTPDVFLTDLFSDLIKETETAFSVKYGKEDNQTYSIRVVVEHLRASAALISSGVVPGNKHQGYVLRRLLRKMIFHSYLLNNSSFDNLNVPRVFGLENKDYPIKFLDDEKIYRVVDTEKQKFISTLQKGIRIIDGQLEKGKIDGNTAFDLYQTNGIPLELTLEILENRGLKFSAEDKKGFEEEFEAHKEKSRSASAGVFKGGLADHSPQVIKLHTATHLLLASLRKVLGEHVMQKGQNITKDRARFDFPNEKKLTEEQAEKVEKLINKIVKEDLPVKYEVLPKDEAIKTGAIHAFNEKYADTVKVYFVGTDLETSFSKEFCGGPHVASTGEIGRVKIKRQEKIGAGLMRIYIVVE